MAPAHALTLCSGAKLVVNDLPDVSSFKSVANVAQYREYRDDLNDRVVTNPVPILYQTSSCLSCLSLTSVYALLY